MSPKHGHVCQQQRHVSRDGTADRSEGDVVFAKENVFKCSFIPPLQTYVRKDRQKADRQTDRQGEKADRGCLSRENVSY